MGRKGVKGLSLVGHEKVPLGFGLRTGDHSDTAYGAGNGRRPASRAQITGKNRELAELRTSIFFLRYSTLDWAEMGRQNCVCLRDFGILMKTLSLLLSLYNF